MTCMSCCFRPKRRLKQSSSVQRTQNQEQHNNNIIIKTITADEQHTQAWMKQKPLKFGGRSDHGMAKIDEHRMIIVGGVDADWNILSSCFIYDVRTQQSTPLRHDLPKALEGCCVVANDGYIYVIGGDDGNGPVNTVYRLCLKTEEWATMAPMGTARRTFPAVLKDKYIYVIGGYNDNYGGWLYSTERYSIDDNTWGYLLIRPGGPCSYHCAVSTRGSEIYIVGGEGAWAVYVFDTATLTWKNPTYLRDMPKERCAAAAVVLKNQYLVVIGGKPKNWGATASCLIYDIWCNRWSSTPASMDMIEARRHHTAAVLDGKIVVAGGVGSDNNVLASVECVNDDALLEYAPLHDPLPTLLFKRILEIGKIELERVPYIVNDKPKAQS